MPEERGLARSSTQFPAAALSVSQLTRSLRDLVEHRFPLLWVRGEISNCMVARSGHVYFALKDAQSQVRCVMFRNRAELIGWSPCDGVEVEVQALVTLYEPRGDLQLVVETMRRGGRGALFERFERLKEKLEREGLFQANAKRPLPHLPAVVGIVTSLQGAALHDVLSTLARRNPSIRVIVYPTQVQGDSAAGQIVRALGAASRRAECDVLIVCRGGGSIEDLWSFNDESVARAIRAMPMPVISGVGHETDFAIADFAADQRAPTPTAAAEMVSPRRSELLASVRSLASQLSHRLMRELQSRSQAVDNISRRLEHPARRLEHQAGKLTFLQARLASALALELEHLRGEVRSLLQRTRDLLLQTAAYEQRVEQGAQRVGTAVRGVLERERSRLQSLQDSLHHLSPGRVLERGYSVVQDGQGRVVLDASTLSAGDRLSITFSRGGVEASVDKSPTKPGR